MGMYCIYVKDSVYLSVVIFNNLENVELISLGRGVGIDKCFYTQ